MYDRRVVRGNTFAALVIPVNMQPESGTSEKKGKRSSYYTGVSFCKSFKNFRDKCSKTTTWVIKNRNSLNLLRTKTNVLTTGKNFQIIQDKLTNLISSPIFSQTAHLKRYLYQILMVLISKFTSTRSQCMILSWRQDQFFKFQLERRSTKPLQKLQRNGKLNSCINTNELLNS